jgi:Ca-activated chloride channel family protein
MHDEVDDARLTAYAEGQLDGDERAAVQALLATSEEARGELEEIRDTAAALRQALAGGAHRELTAEQRAAVEAEAAGQRPSAVRRPARTAAWAVLAATLVLVVFGAVAIPSLLRARISTSPATYPVANSAAATNRPSAPPRVITRQDASRLRALGYMDLGPEYASRDAAEQKLDGLRESSAAFNTETYGQIRDNPFVLVSQDPRSTFSVDVDTASYSIVRRFLTGGKWPPRDAVRIEELVNYFTYAYAAPTDGRPFAVHLDSAACPWTPTHRLVRIGIKGQEIARGDRPPANLVFLLDVSGSMASPDKLPLVQASMRLLVEELRPEDRVAIVVYAGASGLVLPSTRATDKTAILSAIESLSPGGSTHGSAGIRLAYETAAEGFIEGGVNRVVLATDGDFNVGVTSEGELVRLIEEKAKSGVFLTALGFGQGNLKDATLEKLADHGNGNYAYVDTLSEARKVLVEQIGATLVTIAKDVKLQVEFNPAKVKAFRLIGYENRVLAHQDFNDDTRDAGEIGAGHTVTALYEIVPPGVDIAVPGVDPLKYQPAAPFRGSGSGELLTLKLRYKQPDGDESALMEVALPDDGQAFEAAPADFRFAAAVAAFGMTLRDSPHKGDADLAKALAWARASLGDDPGSFRAEFITLVARARTLSRPLKLN